MHESKHLIIESWPIWQIVIAFLIFLKNVTFIMNFQNNYHYCMYTNILQEKMDKLFHVLFMQ